MIEIFTRDSSWTAGRSAGRGEAAGGQGNAPPSWKKKKNNEGLEDPHGPHEKHNWPLNWFYCHICIIGRNVCRDARFKGPTVKIDPCVLDYRNDGLKLGHSGKDQRDDL